MLCFSSPPQASKWPCRGRTGDEFFAACDHLRPKQIVTMGVVSGLSHSERDPQLTEQIQVEAVINPGGPLPDMQCRLGPEKQT